MREEAWPVATTTDKLHDALLLAGFIRNHEAAAAWRPLFDALAAAGRAFDADGCWVAVERFDEFDAIVPQTQRPAIPERLRKTWICEDAARELVRGRMEISGPVTKSQLIDLFVKK